MTAGSITLQSDFLPGTVVGAYKQAALGTRVGPPFGTPGATATVAADSSLAFTGLDPTSEYWATPIPVNEVQALTVDATAGTFRLRFGSDSTPDLAYNISAANLQTALRALPSVGSGNVTVTGGPGDSGGTTPYVITFAASLSGANVASLEVLAGGTALSGGGAAAALVTTTQGRPGGESYVAFTPDQS